SPSEELVQDGSEAKERDENGPWALWGDLKPSSTKGLCECPALNESELLTDILIKYGNNPEGIPAIHYAILKNDTQAVDLLLKHGASPFTKDSHKHDCLYYSILAGSLDLVKKFIELGANPDDHSNTPPLYTAISNLQNDIAKYLIDYGVTINEEQYSDYHYLFLCAEVGNLEIYKTLSKLGVVYARQSNLVRALLDFPMSEKIGQRKMALLNYIFLDEKLTVDTDEIIRNIHLTCPEVLIFLLDNKIIGPNDKFSNGNDHYPILHAALHSRVHYAELVKILLARGAQANTRDPLGRSILYDLAHMNFNGPEDIEKQKETIKLLISYGADINAIDKYKKSLLASLGPSPMYDFLVSLGAKKIGV
ncbi:MAG: ankyrin repeat domain-containing protein, partial [Verrucomicrobia bacterium]|nr:ankyrin repeat domain-containing protein [Verrucomicrobiota bacterium]